MNNIDRQTASPSDSVTPSSGVPPEQLPQAEVVATTKFGRKTTQNPDGAGRPSKLKTVDLNAVRKLGALGCTPAEVASVLGLREKSVFAALEPDSETGAITHFAQAYKKGLEATKRALRMRQIRMALAGDRTMCIWMGKQLLGQRDFYEVDNSTRVDVNVTKHIKLSIFEPAPLREPSTTNPSETSVPKGTNGNSYDRVVGHNGGDGGNGN